MKQHAKSQRVLQTIGVMATLLPYLSKSYEEWGDLMWNTCHSSRISWMKYELAFLNRHMECEFNSDEELTAILISTGIDLKPKLNSEFNLTLDADRKLKNVQGFLKAVKQFRFKSMNKLSIQMFENLDKKSIQDSYHFLKFSIPLKINSFEIKWDDSDIKSYLNSLTILLPRVYHKVEVNSFVLTQKDIKTVSKSKLVIQHNNLNLWHRMFSFSLSINYFKLQFEFNKNSKLHLNISITKNLLVRFRFEVDSISKFFV